MNFDLKSNNVKISNVAIRFTDEVEKYSMIEFDLSWDNSWRSSTGPANWDAVWVFIKFKKQNEQIWHHALLNNTGHSCGEGANLIISPGLKNESSAFQSSINPAIGVFVYRSNDGFGTVNAPKMNLRWNYGDNGLTGFDSLTFAVSAIEMVYIPEASFYLGSGGREFNSFTQGAWSVGNTIPYRVLSESEIDVANQPDKLWIVNSLSEYTIPVSFPKGFKSIYCMKYEISQEQYVDFLNTLSYSQQFNRTPANPNSVVGTGALSPTFLNRNGISIMKSGVNSIKPAVYGMDYNRNGVFNEPEDGGQIACNFLSWMDVAAYLDWCGLRPMTELEFEKIARGNLAPIPYEYAWGSTQITMSSSIQFSGSKSETPSFNSNAVYGNHVQVQGPMRVGCFASDSSSRESSGATYYGVMEFSGNLWERVVTVEKVEGRTFDGVLGDGELSFNGNANELNWPQTLSNEVVASVGVGLRGGFFQTGNSFLFVSDRMYSASSSDARSNSNGGRGVRSSPIVE